VWTLRFVDASTGLDLPRGVTLTSHWSSYSPGGSVVLELRVGTRFVDVCCPGYRTKTIRLEALSWGHSTETVRLEPRSDG